MWKVCHNFIVDALILLPGLSVLGPPDQPLAPQ